MSILETLTSKDQGAKLEIRKFFAGKNVLLSGCTGFLGKVLLEKLMRSCPEINRFYIMIRPKKNMKPIDRVKNEILSSYNFSVLKRQNPKFIEWAESKIIPIQADLVVEHLGLSPEERQEVVENVNVIINSAASVNFDDPIQEALQINYFGCLRVLELAK